MPLYQQESNLPYVSKYQLETFLPIDELHLELFKKHIEYISKFEERIESAASDLSMYFKFFEIEFKGYFHAKNSYKHTSDVARDMDAIINALDACDFAYQRLRAAKKYVHKRIIAIEAIALKRAEEMLGQSHEETLAYLEVPDEDIDAVLDCLEDLEDFKTEE